MYIMATSLCKGKRTSKPNRCRKIKGCKVAKGTKRTFCRKKHNKNRKTAKKRKTGFRRTESERLRGVSVKAAKALRKLKGGQGVHAGVGMDARAEGELGLSK